MHTGGEYSGEGVPQLSKQEEEFRRHKRRKHNNNNNNQAEGSFDRSFIRIIAQQTVCVFVLQIQSQRAESQIFRIIFIITGQFVLLLVSPSMAIPSATRGECDKEMRRFVFPCTSIMTVAIG